MLLRAEAYFGHFKMNVCLPHSFFLVFPDQRHADRLQQVRGAADGLQEPEAASLAAPAVAGSDNICEDYDAVVYASEEGTCISNKKFPNKFSALSFYSLLSKVRALQTLIGCLHFVVRIFY